MAAPYRGIGTRWKVEQMEGTDDVEEPGGGADHWGEAVTPTPSDPARPGDIVVDGGVVRLPEPMVGSGMSTPLGDHHPGDAIPPCPLWAMAEHRHIQWHLLPSHERHRRIRDALGSGDETVYVIDDGAHHVMVGRRIGAVDGECEYCLVGRVPFERYESLRSGEVPPHRAFEGAAEITVCGVAQEEGILSSNVFDVARYGGEGEVPVDYLPGAPYHHFESALEVTVG